MDGDLRPGELANQRKERTGVWRRKDWNSFTIHQVLMKVGTQTDETNYNYSWLMKDYKHSSLFRPPIPANLRGPRRRRRQRRRRNRKGNPIFATFWSPIFFLLSFFFFTHFLFGFFPLQAFDFISKFFAFFFCYFFFYFPTLFCPLRVFR